MNWLTGSILFLLYLNVPAVLAREHGLPLIMVAALPLLLAIPIAYRMLVQHQPVRFPTLFWAALVLLASHALSAVLSSDPSASMDEVTSWLFEGVLLVFLILNAVRTRVEIHMALHAIIAAGAVMGLVVIVQQLTGATDSNLYGFGQLDAQIGGGEGAAQRRLAGPIGETNRFAQIMAVLLPIAGVLTLGAQRHLTRLALALATLLIMGGIALTYSRGAMLALVLALPFALLFGILRLRHLLVAGVLGLALLAILPQYLKRMESMGQVAVSALGLAPAGFQSADGATRGRLTEMRAAGMIFLDNPMVGVGPGLARSYYADYAVMVGGKVRAGVRRSHNLYLQLAAETGVLGLLTFTGVLLCVFVPLDRMRRRRDEDPQLALLAAGLELALIIQLITSLFLHAAYVRYFWLLLALAASVGLAQPRPVLARVLNELLQATVLRLRGASS